MSSEGASFARLMTQIFKTLENIRISREISRDEKIKGETGEPQLKFIEGVGESIYDTYLRSIGLLKLTQGENAQISVERRIEDGANIVDALFRTKDSNTIAVKKELVAHLELLQIRVTEFVRDINLTEVRRIRKLIGESTSAPRTRILSSTIDLTDDVRDNINKIRRALQTLEREKDQIGVVTTELRILRTFIADVNNLLTVLSRDNLAEAGSILTGLTRENTKGLEMRFEKAIRRYETLNNELILAENEQRLVSTGARSITTGEKLALKNVLDTLIYLARDVNYVCKECKFFCAGDCLNQGDQTALATVGATDTTICINANQRNDLKGTKVQKGVCDRFKRTEARRPTNEKADCSCVWADTPKPYTNPFWQANSKVIEEARKRLVIEGD